MKQSIIWAGIFGIMMTMTFSYVLGVFMGTDGINTSYAMIDNNDNIHIYHKADVDNPDHRISRVDITITVLDTHTATSICILSYTGDNTHDGILEMRTTLSSAGIVVDNFKHGRYIVTVRANDDVQTLTLTSN